MIVALHIQFILLMSILVSSNSLGENLFVLIIVFQKSMGQDVDPDEKIALAQSHIVKGFTGWLL